MTFRRKLVNLRRAIDDLLVSQAPRRRSRYAPNVDLLHEIVMHTDWCFECESDREKLAHQLAGDWDRGREAI